jgi:hypothetical protein
MTVQGTQESLSGKVAVITGGNSGIGLAKEGMSDGKGN